MMCTPFLYRWVSVVRDRADKTPNHQKGYTVPIDDPVGPPARSHLLSTKGFELPYAL